MAVKEFLENTPVFTAQELFATVGRTQANANLLSRAKRAGKVLSPMREVYVSNTGRFRASETSPYEIAANLGSNVVFAYDSALDLLVGLHNITHTTSFYADEAPRDFVFLNRRYRRFAKPRHIRTRSLRRMRASALVTTKEQTIVDCLGKPARCGGAEALLRSLSAVEYVDERALADLALAAGPAVSAKCGWLLERKRDAWGIDRKTIDALRERAGGGPAYFDKTSRLPRAPWSARWRLYLPAPEEEMERWLEG